MIELNESVWQDLEFLGFVELINELAVEACIREHEVKVKKREEGPQGEKATDLAILPGKDTQNGNDAPETNPRVHVVRAGKHPRRDGARKGAEHPRNSRIEPSAQDTET